MESFLDGRRALGEQTAPISLLLEAARSEYVLRRTAASYCYSTEHFVRDGCFPCLEPYWENLIDGVDVRGTGVHRTENGESFGLFEELMDETFAGQPEPCAPRACSICSMFAHLLLLLIRNLQLHHGVPFRLTTLRSSTTGRLRIPRLWTTPRYRTLSEAYIFVQENASPAQVLPQVFFNSSSLSLLASLRELVLLPDRFDTDLLTGGSGLCCSVIGCCVLLGGAMKD